MYNQVLVTVLNKIELLDRLLDEFEKVGVSGATVISSVGMAHALAEHEESHFISSFRAFFGGGRAESKTIFTACDSATAEKAKDAVRRIVRMRKNGGCSCGYSGSASCACSGCCAGCGKACAAARRQ